MTAARAAVAGFAVFAAACGGPPPADRVLTGATVLTMRSDGTRAEAIAVRDGAVVAVGPLAEVEGFVGPETVVERLAGGAVLPGFVDAHTHPLEGGLETAGCWLGELETREAVLAEVARCAADVAADDWLVGHGWQLPLFGDRGPSRQELDAVVGERPAYLVAVDGHSAWLSSRALSLAGIDRTTPDPPAGRIEREPDGAPSGTLRESAKQLVAAFVPPPSPEAKREALARALGRMLDVGLTTVLDAKVDAGQLAVYVASAGELPLRVHLALLADPTAGADAERRRLEALRAEAAAAGLVADRAKIFVDGVLESATAALVDRYVGVDEAGPDGGRGPLDAVPEAFAALAVALDAAGFGLHFHAIGDRAVRVALDAIAVAESRNGLRDRRPHLAHLELVHPDDVLRFRALGAVAVFQPLWAQRDRYVVDLTEPKLGPERSTRIYPLGSLARSGAVVAGGSDWSVSSMSPLEAIETAVTRRDPAAPPGPAWLPDETLSLDDALAAYTRNGAWALGLEREIGTLEVGKRADVVVLERDPFAVSASEIAEIRVVRVYVGGRPVGRSSADG